MDSAAVDTCRSAPARGIVRVTFSLAGLLALVRVAGFVEKQVLAYRFGTQESLDVYFVAASVPMMVFFCATAVFGPTILPMFVARVQRGDARGAWAQFNTWLWISSGVALLLAGLAWAYAADFARLLAPGFQPGQQLVCAGMIRLLAPAVFVMTLVPLTASVLNAQRRFGVPPFADLCLKCVTIAALVFLGATLGVKAAALGFTLGAVLVLVLHVSQVRRLSRFHSAPALALHDPDFGAVLVLMAAPALGAVFSRLGGAVENAACSGLGAGSVAELEFARRIVNLPLLIVPIACATVLFTVFSELKGREETEVAVARLRSSLHFLLFLFLPLIGLVMLLSDPIVAVVYQRGRFDAGATEHVAYVLAWLAPGIGFEAVEMILMRYFFSQRDVWTPTLLGLACTAIKIGLVYALLGTMGIAAVALAIVAARALKVGLLLIMACRRAGLPMHQWGFSRLLELIPPLVACLLMAWAVEQRMGPALNHSLPERLALLCMAGGAAAGVYLLASWLMGISECKHLTRRLAAWTS